MTKQVGVYDPATAKMVLEVVRYLRQSGYVITRPGRGDQNIAPPTPIYVRNDSGEAIPPFACMQTTGTVEAGGQNYITVDKPADTDGASGAYLFNGVAEIEIDGYGVAHDGPVVRMLTDGSSVSSGQQWSPAVGEWAVEPGAGPFIAIGADDIGTNVMRGRIGGGLVAVDVITGATLTSTHLEFSLTRIWVNKSEELEDVIQIALDSCEEEPEE